MPETYVRIALPDGRQETIYSPSSIIRHYMKPASELSISDFGQLCDRALDHASQRVLDTHGFACTSAMAEKSRIRQLLQTVPDTDASQTIHILAITS